ncbi:MAG TPA: hypothetical protein VNA22_09615 [Pyrinomonadaceae bacterium]|nr:hypothetical protein [Pyrinomonadaceae bacterium]
MTNPKDLFAKCPREVITRSGDRSTLFEIVDDRYAIHASGKEPDIVPDPSGTFPSGSAVGPVYAVRPSGAEAIPTGLVFVRFSADVNAADRRAEIEAAGYEIAEVLSYAPEAAWLRATSGDIAEALVDLGKLEKLSGVENVEPQMLMKRVSK